MEEAKNSLNIKFNLGGYDTQLTIRSDSDTLAFVNSISSIPDHLRHIGATPERRWENNKPASNHQQQEGDLPMQKLQVPTCEHCDRNDRMESIEFREKGTGKVRQEWKCQRCNKWHYPNGKNRR